MHNKQVYGESRLMWLPLGDPESSACASARLFYKVAGPLSREALFHASCLALSAVVAHVSLRREEEHSTKKEFESRWRTPKSTL